MTLKEAIESGKPFRRQTWMDWRGPYTTTDNFKKFSIEAILATDYILKEDPKFLWALKFGGIICQWEIKEATEQSIATQYEIGKTAIKLAEVSE